MCEKLTSKNFLKKFIKRPTKRLMLLSAFVLVLSFSTLGCSNNDQTVESTHFLMDTVVNIEVFGKDKKELTNSVNKAFNDMQVLCDQFDRYSSQSELSQINKNAGVKATAATDDIMFIVDFLQKQKYNQVDITIGPLIDLWNSSKEKVVVPEQKTIDDLKGIIGFEKVVIDNDKKEIFLPKANMSMDFGSVAKGYVVEKISQKLAQDKAISYAIINGGGNIKTIGQKADKSLWRIGVQDPMDKNKLLGVLTLGAGKAVATSGDYQRFFEVDGKRYHHILDAKTGYPRWENISVTVICNDAFLADYYSTLLFLLPLEDAITLAKKQNVQAIFVHKDKKIYLSEDLKGIFKKNEQNNWQYVQK